MKNHVKYPSIDDYILSFPDPVQNKLNQLREAVREAAPLAQEKISYQMPTFFLNGNLIYFAAFAKHIGFYPGSSGIQVFKSELTPYKTSKGTVQFPLDQPLPIGLIKEMVSFRFKENRERK